MQTFQGVAPKLATFACRTYARWRLGLARGGSLDSILHEIGHVAEGVAAARAVHALATALNVEMPICEAVYQVLYEKMTPRHAVETLLAREPGREFQ